jgi:arylsulfatase A-like enzyme
MYVPGMNKKQECYRNINLIDLYPTLIDLCKLPKKEIDGKSFVPLLKNPTKKWTPSLTTMGKGNHSVMTEKWHYIYREKDLVEELYDIQNDPMEWNNLIRKNTPEILVIKKELKALVPMNDVDAVQNDAKGNSSNENNDGKKGPDLTIKARRILSELK